VGDGSGRVAGDSASFRPLLTVPPHIASVVILRRINCAPSSERLLACWPSRSSRHKPHRSRPGRCKRRSLRPHQSSSCVRAAGRAGIARAGGTVTATGTGAAAFRIKAQPRRLRADLDRGGAYCFEVHDPKLGMVVELRDPRALVRGSWPARFRAFRTRRGRCCPVGERLRDLL
jgi:hypothetical protein